ncbi:alpha-1,3/1,6-mannosyltransferase Alg2 [Rhodnius prolixus]
MSSKNIVFLHPDLGVGGAERLVVDAAMALKGEGYNVSFVTSYHNRDHCFEETKNGDLKVTVVGKWIPRNILGRFFALCAYLKMIYCAFYIIFFEKPDLVFCDLISVCIPILHLNVKNVVYYCHFPDQLLSKKGGFFKQIYRLPLNWLEEKTICSADKVYVNSEFTKEVYIATFTSSRKEPTVLYPSINTKSFDNVIGFEDLLPSKLSSDKFLFISINRYERKKHIELAINALARLKKRLTTDEWDKIILVVAGGYDPRVQENLEYFVELNNLVSTFHLEEKVLFLRSPSDIDKIKLLKRCNCLIYTPPNEHFGIVPLEAMYCAKPVIACNSGGPTETIINESTGLLCHFDVEEFSNAMSRFILDKNIANKMGREGCERFKEKFSFEAFAYQLSADVKTLLTPIKRN